jgi:hypothetical protein
LDKLSGNTVLTPETISTIKSPEKIRQIIKKIEYEQRLSFNPVNMRRLIELKTRFAVIAGEHPVRAKLLQYYDALRTVEGILRESKVDQSLTAMKYEITSRIASLRSGNPDYAKVGGHYLDFLDPTDVEGLELPYPDIIHEMRRHLFKENLSFGPCPHRNQVIDELMLRL